MILDTSVLFDGLFGTPLGEQARGLVFSNERLRAPDLIVVEIAGAITRAVRRKELEAVYARRLLSSAHRTMPETDPSSLFLEQAFGLSLDLNHPISDCIFLAQAVVQDDVLVTADVRFLRKLVGTPHAARAMHISDWRP